ncbi:hypothetical protein M758_1G034400 [Ceratodon purpureus]|uniref:Uncharacterized protein n=1 Tax=Ceratodon purpureus TaxID=3225 RepID=A0A8T0J282_CERPU|nr:hypothetical protein KC19_1G036400 [Ceratodon purpureus]KAG0628539.1 hypothetical protein M758_1G034400 [Ceratodon purpureus]
MDDIKVLQLWSRLSSEIVERTHSNLFVPELPGMLKLLNFKISSYKRRGIRTDNAREHELLSR